MISDIDGIDLRRIDLNLLVVFDALHREQSVSRAARALRMSQSAASAALGRLREVFEDPLFTRTASGIAPTTRSIELAATIRPALAMLHRAVAHDATFDPVTARRSFVIAMSDDVEAAVLAPLMAALAPYGGIRLLSRQTYSGVAAEMVEHGEVDLAVAALESRSPTLRSAPLFRSGYRCIYNSTLLDLPDPLTLESYVQTPHLLISHDGRRGIVDDVLESHGLERRVAASTTHFGAAAALLATAPLLVTMPSHAATAYARIMGLTTADTPIPMPEYAISLIWRAAGADDPGGEWIRSEIVRLASSIGTA